MPSAKLLTKEELCELEDLDKTDKVVGQQFGRLTALFVVKKTDKYIRIGCECECGNCIVVRKDGLVGGTSKSCGCLNQFNRKHGKRKLKTSDMIDTIHRTTEYLVVDTGDGRANGVWTFSCPRHGEFRATWRSVKRNIAHCPTCSASGYRSTNPGYLYLHNVYNSEDVLIAVKIGITNLKVNQRLKQTQRYTSYRVENEMYLFCKDGRDALDIENLIKAKFERRYLTKEEFLDGYTETFSPEDKSEIVKVIKQYI